jgi:hypothetical protein
VTEHVARELAKLQPCLRHQPRRIFLHAVQCKFQLDTINTSDLTASSCARARARARVCERERRYENGETNLKRRCAIKFCVKLNENATETYEKLKRAYREHTLLRAQVFRWHKAFLDGHENVEDEPRSGRLHVKHGRKCDQSESCHV